MCKIRRALAEVAEESRKDSGDWAQFNHQVHLLVATSVAINKITTREGGNGICLDCGDPIPAKRLRAIPNPIRCTACEEREEDER